MDTSPKSSELSASNVCWSTRTGPRFFPLLSCICFLFIYLKQEQVDPGYDSGLAKTWYISAILDSKKSYKTL